MSTTSVSKDEIEDFDDFLPMPGADDVLTGSGKPSMFSREQKVDMSFLDEEDTDDKDDKGADDDDDADADKSKDKNTAADFDKLVDDFTDGDDDQDPEKKKNAGGRKKVDKSGMVEVFSKLIEEDLIIPFEDDKPLEEYSVKDWKDLLNANFEEKRKTYEEELPKKFFESLPEELQYAAKYVMDGGTDVKGMFKALAQTQEVRELDVDNPKDQETILYNYLQATRFGTPDEIEEQLESWKEGGQLEKWAKKHKPKLDKMHEQVVQSRLEQQEEFKAKQKVKKEEFLNNVYETLKPADLNGIKLDSKRQKFLWEELTQTKYESLSGRPTNLLGHLLEKHQFGDKPRYDLIAEALWLLNDPDDYKEQIKIHAKNEVTKDTVRKLKTEEGRKIASNGRDDERETEVTRKIKRQPTNIFKRN